MQRTSETVSLLTGLEVECLEGINEDQLSLPCFVQSLTHCAVIPQHATRVRGRYLAANLGGWVVIVTWYYNQVFRAASTFKK